jgi:serine/threonine-protein kinase
MDAPVFDGDAVYFAATDGKVTAVNRESGRKKWIFRAKSAFHFGPSLADGMLYVGGTDGFLYAVDAKDGTEKWSFHGEGFASGAPVIQDGQVCFGAGKTVYLLN